MPEIQAWFQSFWAWSLQPVSQSIEFALRYGVGIYFFVVAAHFLAKQFPKTTEGKQFNHSEVKTFRSKNDEMIICMTVRTLKESGFSDGQKVNFVVNGGEPIAVTIQRKNKQTSLDNGQVLVAISVLHAVGVEEAKISRAVVSAVAFGWKSLMLQSFDHPDVNVRLAWLLSLWSFLASALAGVLISHFHMLMPK